MPSVSDGPDRRTILSEGEARVAMQSGWILPCVEEVVIVATGKRGNGEVEFREVEHVELFGRVQRIGPLSIVEGRIEIAEPFQSLGIHPLVLNFIQLEIHPRPAQN